MPPSLRSFRRPSSPTGSATTSASVLDLGDEGPRVIVTRADLRASVTAYENLLATAKAYRNALLALSSATTAFAGALEQCARVKGAGEAGEQLLAASGLQYMVANSGQVLSDTLYRSFEIPLLHAYDTYVASISTRHAEYEALLATRTAEIRQTEADNVKQGRKKSRDLSQFRKALEKLQEQVAEVEICKRSYYHETLEHETENWGMIGEKVALLLRSTLDLADRLSSKATSDPIIEAMLSEHPDPFDSYRLETDEDRDVFTILPPLGNLGLGGSKRGSVIDMDKDSVGSGSKGKESVPSRDKDEAAMVTPRQAKKLQPSQTAADFLGLPDDGTPATPDSPLPHTPRQVPTRLHLPRTHSGSSSANNSHSPSPTREAASPPDENASLDLNPQPPALAPAPKFPSLTSVPKKARRPTRRPLSRVSEQADVDPMAGDWDVGQYSRTLSPPGLNGHSGDDDEYESEADHGVTPDSQRSSPPDSPERRLVGDPHHHETSPQAGVWT